MNKKIIVNTDIIVLENRGSELVPIIRMLNQSGWLECAPFKNNIEGLAHALSFCAEVVSGKFVPVKVYENEQTKTEAKLLEISKRLFEIKEP